MKIYRVKVNGKAYEVEVEAVDEVKGHVEAAKAEPAPAAPSEGANVIKAPMAGTILNVKVSVGQEIKAGDTVVILEAMKLENDIKSQFAGKVVDIKVSKGSAVKNGDALIVLG